MLPNTGRRIFSREQKMGAILLFVFALLAVGLGFLQLRNNLYGPFVIRPRVERAVADLFTDDITRLQQIDTDHDGLNDYEELEFYNTSPYLPDTDSDGVKDKEEVEKGTDPLCVEGQECKGAEELDATGARPPVVSPLFEQAPDALDVLGSLGGARNDAVAGTNMSVEALANNPAALRKLLIESGKISDTDLKKIDDATLLSIVKNLLNQTATTTQ